MDQRLDKHHGRNSKSKKKGAGASAAEAPHFRSMAMVNEERNLAFGKDVYSPKSAGIVSPQYVELTPTRETSPWEEAKLTIVGLYYPLGPCLERLPRNKLEDVLDTLRRVFAKLSLHTKYNNSPISALCRSLDQVAFEVVILGARDDSEQIIVEISKQEGDCYTFHLYAKQIMSAVTGQVASPEPVIRCTWNLEALSQADSVGDSDESILEAIDIAGRMVSSERYDARKLALESLVHMTDPNKSGWSTSKAMAQCLLLPSDETQRKLSGIILHSALMNSAETPFGFGDASDDDDDDDDDSFDAANSYLGLVIMAQALQIAAGAKTLDLKTFLDMCSFDLVGCILEKISEVQSKPHDAYYAVQALAALCDCVPSVRSRVRGADVEEAQLVGESSHLALATVSEKLLVSLQA